MAAKAKSGPWTLVSIALAAAIGSGIYFCLPGSAPQAGVTVETANGGSVHLSAQNPKQLLEDVRTVIHSARKGLDPPH